MRYKGIVIKKINVGEYDQLVVLYTQEFGKITTIAKSIVKPKSKQASHLDILNLVSFSLVKGNGYPIITSSISSNGYRRLKESLPALALSLFLTEVIDKSIFNNDRDDNLWNFFIDSLDYLNSMNSDIDKIEYDNIFNSFHKKVLRLLGYYDETSHMTLEEISQKRFNSLSFIKEITK